MTPGTLPRAMDDRERQLEIEGAQRRMVGVLAILAALFYLVGQALVEILVTAKQPSTGLLQGLTPALEHGAKAAAVDPRAADLRFLDKHGVVDIIGWTLAGCALIAMRWPLRYLRDAAVTRGAPGGAPTRVFTSYVTPLVGVVAIAYAIAQVLGAHDFVHGTVKDTSAYNASAGGAVRDSLFYLYVLGNLALALTFVLVALRAMRIGLVTRALGIIGIVGGVIFVIPIVPLPVIQALFLAGVGLMLFEAAGMVLPPAWAAGEAIPWVTQPRQRAGQRDRRAGASRPERGRREATQLAPVPTPPPSPSPSASKKRKRRRR